MPPTSLENRPDADFYIEIDFQKRHGSPSRVFRAMSDLVDSLQEVDRNVIRTVDSKITPVLLLEDVESGSLRAWFIQALESVDDEGVKKGDYKMVVGKYLLRVKYLMIDFLNKKSDIRSQQELTELERSILEAAEDTEVKMLPAYEPVPREKLVQSLDKINSALTPLNDDDRATFVSQEGEVEFNLSLTITPETIEELVTAETLESVATMILKVKKPDFLGQSQWEFRHDNKTIPASILDVDWLTKYQDGRIPIQPGDAIRADVLTQVQYGFDREVVATHYSVISVKEVIPRDDVFQPPLIHT